MNIFMFVLFLFSIFATSLAGLLSAIRGYNHDKCTYPFLEEHVPSTSFCICPTTFPVRVGSGMCCNQINTPRECMCRPNEAYHHNTDGCYKVSPEFTITVDGNTICQNENLKTKKGTECCILNDKAEKYCYCKNDEKYNAISDKCQIVKIDFTFGRQVVALI